MKEFIQKLKFIYLPFLIVSIGFISIYVFLYWILKIKLDLIKFDEDIIDFWLPFILPWIPILLILRKRIKLLNLKNKNGDDRINVLYYMVVFGAFIAPTLISINYIPKATGKLTKVKNYSQIDFTNLTKYYKIDSIYLHKKAAGDWWTSSFSGRGNTDFNMNGYFVVPLMSSPSDSNKRYFSIWYGKRYFDQVSNRLFDHLNTKEAFHNFSDSTIKTFNKDNLYTLEYFQNLGNNDHYRNFVKAVKRTNNYDHSKNIIILEPVYEPFESRLGNSFQWIFYSYAIAGILFFLMIFFPDFDKKQLEKFLSGDSTKSPKHNWINIVFNTIFKPKKNIIATQLIIELNILIFLLMVISGLGFISFDGKDLLDWGGNFRPLILQGQYWRLISNIFLHGGIMHLLMNMYGLLFIGIFLEPLLGSKKFTSFYIVTGIIASLASIWWHQAVVSVGASGAIFGMFGIFLALLLTNLFPKTFQKSFLLSMSIFIGYNLLIGLTGGIDNAAHIGGLISGIIIGFMIYPTLKNIKINIPPIKSDD